MADFYLRKKLQELSANHSTLLWLEGSRTEHVLSVKLSGERLVLELANQTSRVVLFERYAITNVGMQFWSHGRPGVLYRWDQVSRTSVLSEAQTHNPNDEPPTPPDMAA